MRIFGKHIFRSIRKHPLEPIMIVFTVMLCVAVMILSVALPININLNARAGLTSDEWTSDLLVSMKASSERRILFDEDVSPAIEGYADYLGEFSLTGLASLSGSERVQANIGAFDLVEADTFFGIRFLQYGKLTNNNIDSSAIVSERFARELGLSIGDTFTVNVLGQPLSYTVQGIARDTGIFKSKEVLVDISSIRQILADRSSFVASLSSDFNPYTKIHIKAKSGVSLDEVCALLEAREDFADKKIARYEDLADDDFYARILTATIAIPAMLLMIVAAMMIVSAFDLLEKKRSADNALFRIVGAEPAQLNLLVYMESLVYALVGGALGCIISTFAMRWLNGVYSFKWIPLSFDLLDLIVGLISAAAFTSVCALLHTKRQKNSTLADSLVDENLDTDSAFSYKKLVLFIPAILFFAASLLFAPSDRYPFVFVALVLAVILIYVMSPYIMTVFSTLMSRLLSMKKRGAGSFIIAAKSCAKSYPLKHAGRVMTVILTLFISLTSVLSAVNTQMVAYVDFAAFDYAGIHVDDITKSRLSEIPGVVKTADCIIDRNVIFADGQGINGVSVSEYSPLCFNDTISPDKAPEGDEIVLSKGVAAMIGAKVGDRIECTIADVPCSMVLTEIVEIHGDFAFYDAEYVGVERTMTCIRTDGSPETAERITALFDERGIECIKAEEFFRETYDRVNPQITVFGAMFAVMVFMTLVGIFNILAEQRLARRREFEILKQTGMTRGGVATLQLTEVAYLIACALALSLVFSQIIIALISMMANSFGMTLYA